MIKPFFSDRRGCPSIALPLLLILGAAFTSANAQAAGGQRGKPMGSINFGSNGSNPEGTKDPNIRVLTGRVQDTDGKGIKGAVVFLKDKHDSSVKSVVVDDTGNYRFIALPQRHDYEVWAQTEKKKGTLKMISSFDDRTDIALNLKIE